MDLLGSRHGAGNTGKTICNASPNLARDIDSRILEAILTPSSLLLSSSRNRLGAYDANFHRIRACVCPAPLFLLWSLVCTYAYPRRCARGDLRSSRMGHFHLHCVQRIQRLSKTARLVHSEYFHGPSVLLH
jgi:hypothetical protein